MYNLSSNQITVLNVRYRLTAQLDRACRFANISGIEFCYTIEQDIFDFKMLVVINS